uniref:AP-3 complex subunit beta-1/2 C-terminal domain-containing protein n=1 Tax=Romanomermis culicivorax TaxID=13658 RepID=A0A915KA21_ROMCU
MVFVILDLSLLPSFKKISHGMDIQGLCQLENIAVGQSKTLILGVDFADTTQCASIELVVMPGDYRFFVNLIAPVGEQLEPVVMTKDLFKNLQSRLSGMNETSGKLVLKDNLSVKDFPTFSREVYQICNVMAVPDVEEKVCFAGQTLSAKCPVLISFAYFASSTDINETKLTVNCEKMVVGSMLFKQLKSDLSKT